MLPYVLNLINNYGLLFFVNQPNKNGVVIYLRQLGYIKLVQRNSNNR